MIVMMVMMVMVMVTHDSVDDRRRIVMTIVIGEESRVMAVLQK